MKKTLLVIGDGISAKSALFALAKSKKNPFESIIQVSAESFFPQCSLRSTAVASKRGVSTGVSPLGDLIVEGFSVFKGHVQNDGPMGVCPAFQWTGVSHEDEKFFKRFSEIKNLNDLLELNLKLKKDCFFSKEECFVIHPEEYLGWLDEFNQHHLPVQKMNDVVKGILTKNENYEIILHLNPALIVSDILICVGAYAHLFKDQLPVQKRHSSQMVQGSYYEFSSVHLNTTSFSLTLDGHNLVYQAQEQKLLMGATTVTTTSFLPQESTHHWASFWKDYLPESWISQIETCPKTLITGMRPKAQKRSPYLENPLPHLHCLGGLYKNGYTASLLMGQKWLELI